MLPDHSTSLHYTTLSSTTNTLLSSAINTTSLASSSNLPYSTSVASLLSTPNTFSSRAINTTGSLTSVTTSSKFLSLGATNTSPPLSITESSITSSSEPTVLGGTGSDNTITIIAAIIATVLVLLIISIIVILILIAIAYKRRKRATLIFKGRNAFLVNSDYSDIAPSGKEERKLKNMSNPNYQGMNYIICSCNDMVEA